ncbi:MAG: hypothetical protein U0401_26755 [Anaerolineae bacterium]
MSQTSRWPRQAWRHLGPFSAHRCASCESPTPTLIPDLPTSAFKPTATLLPEIPTSVVPVTPPPASPF